MSYDVAIIGAGISGLVAAKSVIEQGLKPIILEKTNRLGGLWNYGKPDGSPLYASLKTNISKELMSLSDFPFPAAYPTFPSHQEVIQYVQSYASQHQLEKNIAFNEQVSKIEPLAGGKFKVITNNNTFEVANVIIATGRFDVTKQPHIRGIETFRGELIHSKQYDNPTPFKGKKVLIVGAAASAMDIAAEVYETAENVTLSVRNMPWVIPNVINGKPADHALTWLKAKLPKNIRELGFKKILMNEYRQRGAHADLSLWPFTPPKVDLERTRFVPNEKMISLLVQGYIKLKSGIERIEGNTVVLQDGSRLQADAIILATGYQTQFPFLDWIKPIDNYLGLYKHIFYPRLPNIAFVGVCNIVGAAFPLVEMQSRLIAAVFANKVSIPSQQQMENEINQHKIKCDQLGIDPMRVQALSYLDEIASIIDAIPKILGNPDVWQQLVFGPLTAFRYRLNDQKKVAEEAKKNIKKAVS